jgi:hypothetical protein
MLIASVAAWMWLHLSSTLSARDPQAQAAARPPSDVFTPAHRSLREAIWDFFDVRPIPVQPIAFTHKVHLSNGMACADCHASYDKGPKAGIPSVTLCVTCHQVIAKDKPEIKKVAAYAARGEDIPWQRVYGFSALAHVRFNHAPHIRAGVNCQSCHGDMTQQTVALRQVNLTMGYCINCHKLKKASIDCTTCHF